MRRIIDVWTLGKPSILVKFDNEEFREYNLITAAERNTDLKALICNKDLFSLATIDVDGLDVNWLNKIRLSADEIWEHTDKFLSPESLLITEGFSIEELQEFRSEAYSGVEPELPAWLEECVTRDSTLDEMIDSFMNSEEELVYYKRILAIYRKITGKPEIIDLISLSDEQMVEKYGSSDINKLTLISKDERFKAFERKMESLKESGLPVELNAVEFLINELWMDGPFHIEKINYMQN